MVKYLSIIKIIIVIDFAELIYKKIIYRFNKSYGIISDKGSVFINAYWSDFCYYTRIKRRFNIVFYFQINN